MQVSSKYEFNTCYLKLRTFGGHFQWHEASLLHDARWEAQQVDVLLSRAIDCLSFIHITTRKTNFNSTHDCAFTCCYCSVVTAGAASRIITLAGSDRDTVTQILLVAFPRRVHEVLNDSQLSSGYRPWKYILGTYLPCWCKSILFLKKRILFTPAFGRYQRPGRRDFKFGVGTSPNCLPFGKWHVFTSLSKCQIMSINIR